MHEIHNILSSGSLTLSLPLSPSLPSLLFCLSHSYSASLSRICKFICVHTHKRYIHTLCPSPYLSVSAIPLYTHTHTIHSHLSFQIRPTVDKACLHSIVICSSYHELIWSHDHSHTHTHSLFQHRIIQKRTYKSP